MKLLPLLALSLTIVSCGKHVHTKFVQNPYDNSGNEARLNDLSQRIDGLAAQVVHDIDLIGQTSIQLAALNDQITQLEQELETADASQVSALQSAINAANATFNTINGTFSSLQSQIDNNVASIAQFEGNDSIVERLDPCSDAPGVYDEILLKTSSGKVVAYFENGGKRYLTELTPNTSFVTTDGTGCVFQVDINGNLL